MQSDRGEPGQRSMEEDKTDESVGGPVLPVAGLSLSVQLGQPPWRRLKFEGNRNPGVGKRGDSRAACSCRGTLAKSGPEIRSGCSSTLGSLPTVALYPRLGRLLKGCLGEGCH